MNKKASEKQRTNLKRKKALVQSSPNAPSNSSGGFAGALKSSIFGAAGAFAIGGVLVLIFSIIAYANKDPNSIIAPLSLSALYISSFLGGVIAVKINRSSALICGILVGIYMITFMFFIAMFFQAEMASNKNIGLSVFLHSAVPVASIAGAYIGISKKSSSQIHRKH